MSTKISELAAIAHVDATDILPIVDVSATETKSVTVLQLSALAGVGVGTQAMADADQTPASSVYEYGTIMTTGALTSNRTLTLPAASNSSAVTKWINNTCTGAYNIVVSTGVGSTVTVGNLKTAAVLFDSRGVTRLTADV